MKFVYLLTSTEDKRGHLASMVLTDMRRGLILSCTGQCVWRSVRPTRYFYAIIHCTGGSSRLQREGPKPADADVIQVHQVYIRKVRFRKGRGKTHFVPPKPEFGPVPPLDPPVIH